MRLGLPVRLFSRTGGTLSIAYRSAEQLDDLINRLTIVPERLPKLPKRQTSRTQLSRDAELQLRFLAHHARVPRRIPDHVDHGSIDAVEGFHLGLDLFGQAFGDRAHR